MEKFVFLDYDWKNLGLDYDFKSDSGYRYDISKHWSEK
jgi:hypothetical protein